MQWGEGYFTTRATCLGVKGRAWFLLDSGNRTNMCDSLGSVAGSRMNRGIWGRIRFNKSIEKRRRINVLINF